ncbi:hypothetical protein V22_06100 [Calycomorphotria hydatis]|uniref:Uncharacterized protein n=1 Tax=Calycomorphotria hydatis TaxID=2528027 RepID=A0A517T4U5_9PLAN|nr:hypothetical protein V22_06100 [Calycomorphotria hydatis]
MESVLNSPKTFVWGKELFVRKHRRQPAIVAAEVTPG